MAYSTEIKKEWYGVKLPKACRAFDCRGESVKDKRGYFLYSHEKAQADTGMVFQCPVSAQGYRDTRDSEETAQQCVKRAIEEFKKYRRLFLKAKRLASNEVGSGYFAPIGICLSNFGWTLLCDGNEFHTIPFKS